jgi:hypothetical protein
MTIHAGVVITMRCDPGSPPGTGANPWFAEIDWGHTLHRDGSGGAGTHTRGFITAATLSALCTAIQTSTTNAGVT